MSDIIIRDIHNRYRKWVNDLLVKEWGSTQMVSRGRIHEVTDLPGFVAIYDGQPQGLITYNIEGDKCELVTLNSLIERQGIGSALINEVRSVAHTKGCRFLWLITTNDNTYAFKFYQKMGFVVVAYHLGAIEESRKLKPGIPQFGIEGVPIRDEIELQLSLG